MNSKYLSSKRLLSGALFFAVANAIIFFIYRVALDWTVGSVSGSANPYRALLYGLRLDMALVAFELAVVGFVAWCFRFASVRLLFLVLWALSDLHALICVSNYWFFRERGQHMWEMLLANLSEPRQIYLAVAPLVAEQKTLAGLMLVCAVGLLWLGIRLSRRTAGCVVDFAGTPRVRLTNLLCILGVFACTLDPIRIKRNDWPLGWYVGLTSSRFYLGGGGYLRNQVVVNPVYDLLTFHLPVALQQEGNFLLTRERALEVVRTLLEIPAGGGITHCCEASHRSRESR